MNPFNKLLNWIKKLLAGQSTEHDGRKAFMHNFAQMLYNTRTEEYSCDEVYHLIDQYAEMAANGEDVAQFMPMIKHHLEMCKDCHEEYEALKRILEAPLA